MSRQPGRQSYNDNFSIIYTFIYYMIHISWIASARESIPVTIFITAGGVRPTQMCPVDQQHVLVTLNTIFD